MNEEQSPSRPNVYGLQMLNRLPEREGIKFLPMREPPKNTRRRVITLHLSIDEHEFDGILRAVDDGRLEPNSTKLLMDVSASVADLVRAVRKRPQVLSAQIENCGVVIPIDPKIFLSHGGTTE